MAEVYLGLTDAMRWDTDLVGKQAELELVCATCKLKLEDNNTEELGGIDSFDSSTVSFCDDITYFSFIFFIFPFRSVLLFPLHSAPSPTHDPPIFQYFINCRHTSHFSAPLC